MKNFKNWIDLGEKIKLSVLDLNLSSTRNETGEFEEQEKIAKEDVNFDFCKNHLKIHKEGEIAGSQFDWKVFESNDKIIDFIKKSLPNEIPFDEFWRSEITLHLSENIWWTWIMQEKDFSNYYGNEFNIEKKARIPWWIEWEYKDQKGTWYAEKYKNPETGEFEIKKNSDWTPTNPYWKFEPLANIAEVDQLPSTKEITLILQKDKIWNVSMLTTFPWENAPAFPAFIEQFEVNSLDQDSLEQKYWNEGVFLKLNPDLKKKQEIIQQSQEIEELQEQIDNILLLDDKTRTFTIPVKNKEINELEDSITIDEKDFQKKKELHITVIGFQKAKQLKKLLKENPDLETELNTKIQEINWQYALKDEKYYLVQNTTKTESLSKKVKKKLKNPELKEQTLAEIESEGKRVDIEKWTITEDINKESIIQMVDIPVMKEFYSKIYNELWIDMGEVPPAHITLYTYGDKNWIAINSEEDIEKFWVKKIENLDNFNETENIGEYEEEIENNNLPYNFYDKLENLNKNFEIWSFIYYWAINEIENFIEDGEDPDWIREDFYTGWKKEDFEELLKKHKEFLK